MATITLLEASIFVFQLLQGGNIREVVGVKAALVEVKKEIAIASTKLLNAAKCILHLLMFSICVHGRWQNYPQNLNALQ